MMKQILVPLDGSKDAEHILGEVRRVASIRDQVHLLHLLPAGPTPVGMDPTHVLDLHERAVSYLGAMRERWLPQQPGLDVVNTGDPAEGILGFALEKNIDLIAMTTHGRGGMARFFLGSVASAVVRRTQLPVLLTRPNVLRNSAALQRILVTVDGMEEPKELLQTVRSLASGNRAEIVLLHVVPPVEDPSPQWAMESSLKVRATPAHHLEEMADALEEQGFAAWAVVASGDPLEQILHQIEKQNVDLVALSTHGRSGLERMVAGSVAEGVMRASPVAVLLQKPVVVHQKPVLQGENP